MGRETISEKIKKLSFWCREFPEEIRWWFSLRDKVEYSQGLALRKPICIELYLFADYLWRAYHSVNKVVVLVNEMYAEGSHDMRLSFLSDATARGVRRWRDRLMRPRNVVAAHRYTNRRGEFLSLKEVSAARGLLGWDKLEGALVDLCRANTELQAWLSDITNHNHLVLADGLVKRKRSKKQ